MESLSFERRTQEATDTVLLNNVIAALNRPKTSTAKVENALYPLYRYSTGGTNYRQTRSR